MAKATRAEPVFLSDMSLLEIATLLTSERLSLRQPLREWLDHAFSIGVVERHPISPAVAAEIVTLPRHFHRDPGDRVIVATARVLGATLLTRDQAIIDAKVVKTL